MKILHVATTLGPENGGAAVACIELCAALAERGHDVEIFTTAIDIPPDWPTQENQPFLHRGITIHFFPVLRIGYYWVSSGMFWALWRKVRTFDVVHIHSLYRFHLPATAWICRWFARPYIVKPHGSLDPFLFKYRRWRKMPHEFLFDRPAYAHAAAVHYVADEERHLAESTDFIRALNASHCKGPDAVVAPEGVSIDARIDRKDISNGTARLIQQFPELQGKAIVLFLGRLNFKKGIDILVEAFAAVKLATPDAHLLFVGPDSEGYSAQIRKWLRDFGVTDQTTFTGMLRGAEKLAAFQLARVFVLSSYTENFGIAIVEAMTQNCPIVISNKVNIWREIQDANAGLVTDCDAVQTASAILRILREPTLSATLSENGARLAREHFTWPAAAEKMEAVYRHVTQDNPKYPRLRRNG